MVSLTWEDVCNKYYREHGKPLWGLFGLTEKEQAKLAEFEAAMNNGSIGRHHCEWAIGNIRRLDVGHTVSEAR